MSSIVEQVGRVIGGRYRLLAVVGAGASAQVFAADDTRLGRRVAVKLLHPALSGDATFLRKFQAEARLAASLNHRNVLHVYDWGDEDGIPYLVLEYLGGGSLRSLLDTGFLLSPQQAAAIGAEAANGLAYAHRRGLVHRDIKPANLLFDDDGRLLVADFGLARALAEAAITEPLGTVVGTARYASPEQVEGRPVDDRTDVYSLALTLYEAVTGRVPFAGETTVATLMARVGAVLPPARELGPLAPVLAQAAISEPLARLDAAGLAYELELLLLELDAPGPLPLSRAYVAVPSPPGGRERDPTDRFPVPADEAPPAQAPEPPPPTRVEAAVAPPVSLQPAEPVPVRAWSIEVDGELDDIDELIGLSPLSGGQVPPPPPEPAETGTEPTAAAEEQVDQDTAASPKAREEAPAVGGGRPAAPDTVTASPGEVDAPPEGRLPGQPPSSSAPAPAVSAGVPPPGLVSEREQSPEVPAGAVAARAPAAPEPSPTPQVSLGRGAPQPTAPEAVPPVAPGRAAPQASPAAPGPVTGPPADLVRPPELQPATQAQSPQAQSPQAPSPQAPSPQAPSPQAPTGVRGVATTATAPPPGARRRKNRWLPWLLVVLLVELGAGAGVLATRSHAVQRDTVPSVTGLSYSAARAAIARTGLYPELVGERYSQSVPAGWVISQVPPRGRREKVGGIVRYVISQGRHPTAVPNLTGMSQAKATATLLGAHLVPHISQRYSETVPSGTVVSWRSVAGSHVFYGDAVSVVFSKGPSPQTIPDNLAGGVSTWTQAESALADVHLTPVQNPRYSTTIPAGFVVTTEPPPGTTVPGHSRVLVFVSQGPPYETIPPIIGKSFTAAEQALAALGLKWQPFGPAGASTVLNTVPSVGQSARYGTTVDVYLH